jgi:transposase
MKDEQLENNLVSLHARGWSIRRLSREFGIGRKRVKRILGQNNEQRENADTPEKQTGKKRGSKLAPYYNYIDELLEAHQDPPITNQRAYELLQDKGYTGKISILRDHLLGKRGKKPAVPIVPSPTAPGQRASHDWSEYHVEFFAGRQKITIFSIILNYSRRQYIELVEDKSQSTLLKCLVNAFLYYGGVPLEIKSDNQKACVDRWEMGRPVFNKHYLGFASHYRFAPLSITPGKPRENLKIERPFYYLETNFLNGRKFMDPEDLKKQLLEWLQQHNDQRVHRTTGQKPIDLFRQEHSYLQALPARQYDTSILEYRVVNNESAIQWANNYYIVPPQHMHHTCLVRISDQQITVYSTAGEQIAQYPLAGADSKGAHIGRNPKKPRARLKSRELADRLKTLGPAMERYMDLLKTQDPKHYLGQWRLLLNLKLNYYPQDINMAVQRALAYKVYDARNVENFLRANAQKKSEITFKIP